MELLFILNRTYTYTSILLSVRANKIPMIIRRFLPDGSYEDWSCDELIVSEK